MSVMRTIRSRMKVARYFTPPRRREEIPFGTKLAPFAKCDVDLLRQAVRPARGEEDSAEAAGFESESEGRDRADAVEFREGEVTEVAAQVRESSSPTHSETRSSDPRAALADALAEAVKAAVACGDPRLFAFAVDALQRLAALGVRGAT